MDNRLPFDGASHTVLIGPKAFGSKSWIDDNILQSSQARFCERRLDRLTAGVFQDGYKPIGSFLRGSLPFDFESGLGLLPI